MIYICVLCNKQYIWKDKNFIETKNGIFVYNNKKKQCKYFCCDKCKETENGKKYLEMQIVRKKIISILCYLLFSILGIIMYIVIIVSFV